MLIELLYDFTQKLGQQEGDIKIQRDKNKSYSQCLFIFVCRHNISVITALFRGSMRKPDHFFSTAVVLASKNIGVAGKQTVTFVNLSVLFSPQKLLLLLLNSALVAVSRPVPLKLFISVALQSCGLVTSGRN